MLEYYQMELLCKVLLSKLHVTHRKYGCHAGSNLQILWQE